MRQRPHAPRPRPPRASSAWTRRTSATRSAAASASSCRRASLPDRLTVTEALTLHAAFYENPAEPAELIEQLGLTHRRDARYGKLSGGEKQKLSVGLALVGRPQLAILDELTTGLDPHARRETWALIESLREQRPDRACS